MFAGILNISLRKLRCDPSNLANNLLTKRCRSGLFQRSKPTESHGKINYLPFETVLQNLHSWVRIPPAPPSLLPIPIFAYGKERNSPATSNASLWPAFSMASAGRAIRRRNAGASKIAWSCRISAEPGRVERQPGAFQSETVHEVWGISRKTVRSPVP